MCVFAACSCLQTLFGIWWLRCDPYFLLAPAEGRFSLQRLSAVHQTGLSVAAASEGDLLPSKPSAFWSGGGVKVEKGGALTQTSNS